MHECHPCQKLATAAVCLVLHALVYVLCLTHLTHDVLCSKVCVLTVSDPLDSKGALRSIKGYDLEVLAH